MVDNNREWANLVAGTGEPGEKMIAEGWRLEVGGNSMIGRCLTTGEADIQLDVDQAPVHLRNPHLPETKSELALPLISRSEILGALTIQSNQSDAFGAEDISILQSMSDQVATAIANARLFEQTQSALLETETLLNISRLVSGSMEIEESLQNVLDLTLKATGIDAGLFSLINPDTNKLELTAHILPEPFLKKLQADGLEGTLCDLIRQNKNPIIARDLTTDSPIDASGLINLGLIAYQGVPIESKGEIYGTFCTFNKSVLEPDESNITLLQAIGQQVGVAIDNVRLFQQTETALAELEATQRRYQIQAWSNYNQSQDASGYIQTTEGFKPIGRQRISEIEEAIHQKTPVVSDNGDDLTLTVPIILRNQPIGALGVLAGKDKHHFTQEEISLIQEISEQFALAAESLRLLDETQRRAARERLVGEITTKLRATNDPRVMLHTAVEELKNVLNAKRTQVYIQNQQLESDETEPTSIKSAESERGEV
jgi:GAF domain-containing protein